MVDIYGSHFEYGGYTSRQYRLIIANVSTERFAKSYGDLGSIIIFNKRNVKRYLVDNDYSDAPLSFDVEFVTDNDMCIPWYNVRNVEKWLFNNNVYKKLYIDILDDIHSETLEYDSGSSTKRLYLNCRFINPERIECDGGVLGYKATLEADSHLWWQDITERSFEVNNLAADSHSMVKVDVDTDYTGFTYPEVKILTGSLGGTVFLSNYDDDSTRLTQFTNLPADTEITLNGEYNYISGQYFNNFYKQNFPRLLNGENSIYVDGNIVGLTFKFNNRRLL